MKNVIAVAVIVFLLSSCKKADNDPVTEVTIEQLKQSVLTDFANKVALQTYRDMDTKMQALHQSVLTFNSTPTTANLIAARNAWMDVRSVWEKSEAFLFGPVSTENIDPGTDTWPVDFHSLDSLLATNTTFNQTFISSLGDELKGYHPSEYLLWGENGNKSATAFTVREKEFLIALTADLQMKASSLRNFWEPSSPGNYHHQVVNAGKPGSVYTSRRAAFEEIVNGMIGICDEVANGKMFEPFAGLDPSLEESPFSGNSLTDFKNNIQGVKNVYTCAYSEDGVGLEDLLKRNNLSLNATIHSKLNNTIVSFNAITVPFGEAIITQRPQVQATMDQINELKAVLEDQLLPYIRLIVTD